MPNVNEGQRITKLESKTQEQDRDIERLDNKVDHIANTMDEIKDDVSAIRLRMEKNISFVGGISFSFSLLGGVFVLITSAVLKKIGVLQ